ncbi:hypothetical protein FOA52_007684 [Chlamydomonas sp. UWO 241]|nr:hypothetical protein FOA52_007684 [Chlamydomonas sp. UWO 241]
MAACARWSMMRCALLLAALVAFAEAGQISHSGRELLQGGFPYCKCDTDTMFNPNRLDLPFPSLVTGPAPGSYINFQITTVPVPIPPIPTPCSQANVGKVEFEVAATARACVRFAYVGPPGAQSKYMVVYENVAGGITKLKVTNLFYSQADIMANGNMIPLLLNLKDGCSISDVFPGFIQYAVFNSAHDCCPIGIILPCNCDSTPGSNSFKVVTQAISQTIRGQYVELRIYSDPAITCNAALGMNKLELDVKTAAAATTYRQSIRNAYINGRKTDAVYWEPLRRSMKFTNLAVPCSVGAAGWILSFDVINGASLSAICGGDACTYAAFDTTGVEGTCPVASFKAVAV